MNHFDKQIYEAFDAVRAEERLKASALEFIACNRRTLFHSNPWIKRFAAVTCMIVLLITGYGLGLYCTPVSIISVDINPSLELGVNCFDRVITVEGYNEDGVQLAKGLQLKNRTIADAVMTIVGSSTVQRLIRQDAFLSLTVVGDDPVRNANMQAKLADCISHIENAECLDTSSSVVGDAHGCGMSYGKYLAALKLLEINDNYTMADLKNLSMREIRELCGIHGMHNSGNIQHGAWNPDGSNNDFNAETGEGMTETYADEKHHGSHNGGKHHKHSH